MGEVRDEFLPSEEEMDRLLETAREFRRGCRRRDREREESLPDAIPDDASYTRVLGKVAPLTHDEVIDLSMRHHAGIAAQELLESGEMLDDEASRRFARLAEMGDLARRHLVVANLPLVFSLAAGFGRGDLGYADFAQAGICGLLLAVDRYDYRLGNRLSTYATRCVLSALERARASEGRLIRLPRSLRSDVSAVIATETSIKEREGVVPTDDEIAEKTGIPAERVRYLRDASRTPIALDKQALENGGEARMADLLVSESEGDDPAAALERKVLSSLLASLIATLNDTERLVVARYFGIGGERAMSLREIGGLLGVSRQAAGNRLRSALGKMRRDPRAEWLADFL